MTIKGLFGSIAAKLPATFTVRAMGSSRPGRVSPRKLASSAHAWAVLGTAVGLLFLRSADKVSRER